jgi:hypothetical protein
VGFACYAGKLPKSTPPFNDRADSAKQVSAWIMNSSKPLSSSN